MRRVWPTLAAVALVALFVALGFWQLGRAQFKRELWADFDTASQSTHTSVHTIAELARLKRYTPVTVTGRYDLGHQVFLDNRVEKDRVGVDVLTPLRMVDGWILVNRGWLPLPPTRTPLPAAPGPSGTVSVSGLVSPPPATGLRLGTTPPPEHWPWLTPYLLMDDVAESLEGTLSDRVILLDPQADYGFTRDWKPATFPPERHMGYAFQWFALAVAVAVVWVALNLRKGVGGSREADERERASD